MAECHAGVSDLDADVRCPEFTLADVFFLIYIYIYICNMYIYIGCIFGLMKIILRITKGEVHGYDGL